MAFGAYGEQYQGPAVDGMFTGVAQVPEANDLRTFPARNLSTVEGRWMSPDPAGLGAVDLGNPQSLNRYAYVVGNPFGLVDLTGLDPTQIYTPPITVTADGPGPISVLSSYSAPGSHCSDRCLDAAEAASYNGAPLIYDLSYRKLVLPAKAGTPAPNKQILSCFVKGVAAGVVTAAAVGVVAAVAAPVVGTAAVTAGLGALAITGAVALGVTSEIDISNHNWARLAYNAGNVVGGAVIGFAGGARVATSIDPNATAGWSLSSWKAQAYDSSKGSVWQWLGTGPTRASAGLATTSGSFLGSLFGGCGH